MWLSLRDQITIFGNYVHPLHAHIKKIHNDFSRTESFSNSGRSKIVGWKAEKRLAFSQHITYRFRLISWFISEEYSTEKKFQFYMLPSDTW